jgi:putative aldouronate transport system permease protein
MTATVALKPPRKGRNRRSAWEEKPTPIGQLFKAILLSLLVFSVLFPLWVILITSISSRESLADAGGFVVIPREIDFSAYQTIFAGGAVTRALWVSTMVTVIGTAVALTVTVLAAYGLSRPQSVGNRWLLAYFLLPFLIYPPLVPKYLVVTGLGLKNTIWALILPSAISVFNLVVMRGFFQGIPSELLDSARIDGAGDFRILWRIVLPLSKAVVAVIGLFYAVGYWNVWFDALLFIDRNDMYPIQRVLQSYLLAGQAPHTSGGSAGVTMPPTEAIKMAVVILTVAPIVIIYPFIQRHFIKGVLIGAVKG